jgi:Putative prokaryotic signal transducing protein
MVTWSAWWPLLAPLGGLRFRAIFPNARGRWRRRSEGRLPRVKADEPVVVTVVSSGPEADIVCGLLRTAGIDCAYRDTEAIDSSLEEFTAAGPREILVHPADLDAARELLAAPADG